VITYFSFMKITKRFHFSASHRLFNPALEKSENESLFGACHRAHGHNFIIDVTVEGRVNPKTGMIVNFHDLKATVHTEVIQYLDHKDFEMDIPEFRTKVQTAENLALIIWKRLSGKFPKGIKLSKICIAETPDNWVEYSGR